MLRDLKKYLVPAQVTKLDWILLNIKVDSFSDQTRWDNFGLVQSISIYSIEGAPFIGITFVVDKDIYLKLDNDIVKKTLTDVVESAFRIIKITLPEIKIEKDIYANFMAGKVIADFKDGKIRLME